MKKFLKENWYYIFICVLGLSLILTNRIITGFNGILVLSDVASIFGIIYIVFNSKNSVWGLLFNLISTIFIAITSFYQHIWLNGIICTCINIPMFIFGIITWKRKLAKQTSKVRINRLSKRNFLFVFLGYLVVSVAFLFILKSLNGNLYYLDAFYSVGSVFGVVLCSLAFIEQFLIFNIANIFGITMYGILCFSNLNNLPLLFVSLIYFIGNIISICNWIRILKRENNDKTEPSEVITQNIEKDTNL